MPFFPINNNLILLPQIESMLVKRLADKYLNNRPTKCDQEILMLDISDNKLDIETMQNLFFTAAKRGDGDLIVALIKAGVDVNAQDSIGYTALMYVTELNDLNLSKILLEQFANPNIKNREGNTAIMFTAIYDDTGEMIDLLSFYNANIHDKNLEGTSALMFAVSNNKDMAIKNLISRGANVEDKDNKGITILMEAVTYNLDITLINLILNNLKDSSSIDVQDNLNETAVMKCENSSTALILLQKGASLTLENIRGETPLLIAAKCGRTNLIDLFMFYQADSQHLNKDGWTALMLAANGSNTDTLKVLLKYCSDKDISYQNESCLTALKIADINKNLFKAGLI